jgi:hypothetical protein
MVVRIECRGGVGLNERATLKEGGGVCWCRTIFFLFSGFFKI